ncbi:MAG: PorP/SprF family type IX secretion system membrane protein, partial [Flavobacteriales bacterium]
MKSYLASISCLAILFAIPFKGSGQDPHFSQFRRAPLFRNPAKAGSFNGDHRAILNYKDQWGSVADPYRTFDLSFDMMAKDGGDKEGSLGIGVLAYRDLAGDLNYGTTKGELVLSYHQPLGNDHFLQAGISGGYAQESIDRGEMKWASQRGVSGYNSSLSSGEGVGFDPISYPDLSAGISWAYATGKPSVVKNEGTSVTAGFSLHHSFAPARSFYEKGGKDHMER